MKLEAGKRYVTRDGQKTDKIIFSPGTWQGRPYQFLGGVDGFLYPWDENGRYVPSLCGDGLDLIAEAPADDQPDQAFWDQAACAALQGLLARGWTTNPGGPAFSQTIAQDAAALATALTERRAALIAERSKA